MKRSSPFSGASLPPFRKKVTCGYFSVSARRNWRSPFAATQVLRALRLLRVFKLLKAWTSLQTLLASLLRAVRPLAWLLVLFALILFIFALLGMQFFGAAQPSAAAPRPNFDSIFNAMLAVTIVATQENWNEIWRSELEEAGEARW